MSDALGWGSSELDIGFSDDATSPVPSLGLQRKTWLFTTR